MNDTRHARRDEQGGGDSDFRRTLWRSRRGLLELDLLLGHFTRHHYRQLDPTGKRAYRALLGHDDWTLHRWLREVPLAGDVPSHLADVVLAVAERGRPSAALADDRLAVFRPDNGSTILSTTASRLAAVARGREAPSRGD